MLLLIENLGELIDFMGISSMFLFLISCLSVFVDEVFWLRFGFRMFLWGISGWFWFLHFGGVFFRSLFGLATVEDFFAVLILLMNIAQSKQSPIANLNALLVTIFCIQILFHFRPRVLVHVDVAVLFFFIFLLRQLRRWSIVTKYLSPAEYDAFTQYAATADSWAGLSILIALNHMFSEHLAWVFLYLCFLDYLPQFGVQFLGLLIYFIV